MLFGFGLFAESVLADLQVEMRELRVDDVLSVLAKGIHRSRDAAVQEGGTRLFFHRPRLCWSLTGCGVVQQLQHVYQQYVQYSPELHEMSMKGYQAALRAYATHSAETKHIFHIKKLHLGHFAKSLACRTRRAVALQLLLNVCSAGLM